MTTPHHTPASQADAQYDRIDRYLQGKMTEAEQHAFTHDLAHDKDLRNRTEAMVQLVKAMDQVGREKDAQIVHTLEHMKRDNVIKFVRALTQCHETEENSAACTNNTNSPSNTNRPNEMQMPFHRPHKGKLRRIATPLSAVAVMAAVFWGGLKYYDAQSLSQMGNEYIALFLPQTESGIMRADVADTHAATEVAKLYNAAYTYQQLDAKTAAATLSQLKALWQKAQSDTYNEYTNQAPLIGWALANVYLINHDELNALHTLDKLIELTAPQSLVQTKAIELRHKIRNRKKIFGLL